MIYKTRGLEAEWACLHHEQRYALGLSSTHIKGFSHARSPAAPVRDGPGAPLVGDAAERVGLDRRLNASTTKKRTHSRFRQGLYGYGVIPNMREHLLEDLLEAFAAILREPAVLAGPV